MVKHREWNNGKQIDLLDKGFFWLPVVLADWTHLHLDSPANVCGHPCLWVRVCVCVLVRTWVCVSFIDQQMKSGVCVMRSRQPDGLMGNKKPLIYLYDLIKWHLFLSLGVCMCPCEVVCVCALYLMTNRIEGSEQSGLSDYYGNEGERERGSRKEGRKTVRLQNLLIPPHEHDTEIIASVCWSLYLFHPLLLPVFLHSHCLFFSEMNTSILHFFLLFFPLSAHSLLYSPLLHQYLSLRYCFCNNAINYSGLFKKKEMGKKSLPTILPLDV